MELTFYPAIAGLAGVMVMIFFLRRARFLHLPETQMLRAIGSMVTKDPATALKPGAIIHILGGVVFAYIYAAFISTAPGAWEHPGLLVVICTMMGFVHGLIVTLFLVISVAQYHPVKEYRRLEPGDMAAHVIAHIAYGVTLGITFAWLPKLFA